MCNEKSLFKVKTITNHIWYVWNECVKFDNDNTVQSHLIFYHQCLTVHCFNVPTFVLVLQIQQFATMSKIWDVTGKVEDEPFTKIHHWELMSVVA